MTSFYALRATNACLFVSKGQTANTALAARFALVARLLPFGPYPLQQLRRRFVAGVLRHQAAGEGALQDALPQPACPLQVGGYLDFQLVHDRQATLDFGDDLFLFPDGGQGALIKRLSRNSNWRCAFFGFLFGSRFTEYQLALGCKSAR